MTITTTGCIGVYDTGGEMIGYLPAVRGLGFPAKTCAAGSSGSAPSLGRGGVVVGGAGGRVGNVDGGRDRCDSGDVGGDHGGDGGSGGGGDRDRRDGDRGGGHAADGGGGSGMTLFVHSALVRAAERTTIGSDGQVDVHITCQGDPLDDPDVLFRAANVATDISVE